MAKVFANSGNPDQMLHSVASGLGQHCWLIPLLGVFRLIWVKKEMLTQLKLLRGSILFVFMSTCFKLITRSVNGKFLDNHSKELWYPLSKYLM